MRIYYNQNNGDEFKSIDVPESHECTECGEVVKPGDKKIFKSEMFSLSVCRYCGNDAFMIFKEIESNLWI